MDPARMHVPDAALIDEVLAYLRDRLLLADAPIDRPASPETLATELAGLLTPEGRPVGEVLRRFTDVVAVHTLSADSPRFLAFIPGAPTKASLAFDAVISASSLSGISWLESAGAVAAENQVLRWIADLFGMPESAGGTFVSGGSAGNLSALAVARQHGRQHLGDPSARVRVAVSDQAHSSISTSLMMLDIDALIVPTRDHRLTGEALAVALLNDTDPRPVVAVVATAGTTNAGIVDDLAGVARVAREYGLWLHVDAAYGGAAVLSHTEASRFAGIEHADSIVTDPHKWWFAPFDSAALLWREPNIARSVLTQDASYLEPLHEDATVANPSDLAYHLTRRARGLALWFSVAVYGEQAYREAVQASIDLATWAGEYIEAQPHVELVREPSLSVVLWRRRGWQLQDYRRFQDVLLERQLGLVTPTSWEGESVGRFVFLNPRTTPEMVKEILALTH